LFWVIVVVVGGGAARAAPPRPALPRAPYEEVLASEAAALEARASQPAAAGALAALAALDEDVEAAALEAAVRGALAKGAHPLVAAQASSLLAHLLDQRGETREATSLRASLGLLSHFFVIGPFGEGRASLTTVFPPEQESAAPALGKTYPGKSHDVGWRVGDAAVRDGALDVDGLLRPADQGVAYVVTFVRSDRDRPAALRLGSPGPIKVWVNGAPVFTHDVVRPVALDQDAVGIRLGRGWNRILIKTVVTDGAWRLYARVTDAAGAAIPVSNDFDAPPAASAMARRASQPAPKVDALDVLLERRARRLGAAGGAAWADLARWLAWTTPRDRDDRAASAAFARSFKLLAPSGAGEARAAGASSIDPALRLAAAEATDDDDERRRMLEQALDAQPAPPWRALLLARLGVTARAARRDAAALEAWRDALAIDPDCWTASLAIAQEEADAGLPLTAVTRLEALPAHSRNLSRVRRAAVRVYDMAGRQREADRVLADLAHDRRRDVDLMHQLSIRARRRGDGEEARARLAGAAALRPDLPSLEIELGRLLEGAGDTQRALATLRELAARLPDEPAALVALGKLLHRTGKGDEALAPLRAALALRPQDPELKRYVDRLAAGEHGDLGVPDELARRFADDAMALLPPAGQAPGARGAERGVPPREPVAGGVGPSQGPPYDERSGAVVLLDRRVVRVHKNGLSRTFAQRIVQVLTERGAEENKEFAVHYTPGREEVDIRQARVYRRNARGEVSTLEATDRSDEDLSEPWYGLYYDNRAEVVRFEGLRPGDVVEIQYLVDDVGSDNQMADYFGDLQFIGEQIPKRRWDYTLIAPVSRPIHANVPRLPRLERQESVEGGDRVYRFAARDVAKVDAEPAMPGAGETSPYLHVSTYASWADVGAWYWRLVEESLGADDEVRRTARGLVKKGMTDGERVRAVYDFVLTGTRYVGLEFGIHGFKPYKVTQVLARRFGDCKDKASLMIALLREVGVPAELVLVRTRRGGRLDPEPASLAIFDHAIVYVPKLDRYLDGTAEFSGPTELPAQDQGVVVLRVGPHGSMLTETPVLPSSDNHVQRRWQVAVEASGDARVDEELIIRGQAAPNWREHYQTEGERKDRYGRVWSGRFPGARLDTVAMPDIEDRSAPVTVRAGVTVPRLARASVGGGLDLPVTGRDADFVRTYARLSARRQELVLGYPWQHDEELSYRLPPGWRLTAGSPPARRLIEGPFGKFTLDIEIDGAVLRVRSSLNVERARIAPEDYPRFRAFLLEVDAALGSPIGVSPPTPVGS
jgi:transglutaminase-like putative cysteine protease/Flp pilus assembly protein TadD